MLTLIGFVVIVYIAYRFITEIDSYFAVHGDGVSWFIATLVLSIIIIPGFLFVMYLSGHFN